MSTRSIVIYVYLNEMEPGRCHYLSSVEFDIGYKIITLRKTDKTQ